MLLAHENALFVLCSTPEGSGVIFFGIHYIRKSGKSSLGANALFVLCSTPEGSGVIFSGIHYMSKSGKSSLGAKPPFVGLRKPSPQIQWMGFKTNPNGLA